MEQEAVATTTAPATAATGDAFNDIQNYLTDFNKEIQSGGTNQAYNVEGYYQGAPPGYSQFQQQQQTYGTYTTADGSQAQQGQEDIKKVVQNGEEGEEGQQVEPPALEKQVTNQEGAQMIQVGDGEMVALQAGDQGQAQIIVPSTQQGTSSEGQVVLNQDNYQTVTIVPSDNQQGGGEVSYVLIVSQPDGDKDAENMDMSVYDFKGEEMTTLTQDSDEDGGGAAGTPRNKVIRVTPKKMPPASTSALMCNYCNYTSPKRYLLTRHMKTHSDERPHKCSICNRGFKTIASLQNHVNTHTGTRPHKCKDCEAAFTTSGELVRHTRYRHTFEKPHKCTECDYASVELSKLKRHMRSHTGERPYACPHCLYASPDTFKLKRHLRIHTGEKPYECDICHARFTQSNSLKSHKLIHSGNKPIYQCELCPTTCGRKTDLKIHVQKLHTSDVPLCCKKCNKSFPDRYTYRLHVKVHDGEKCYKCELCAYAALSPRHLESHILTHTGEKPYQCEECQQCFRQKQLLRRHKNLYHTPDYVPPTPKEKQFQCMECDKAFAHKGNLLRHVQMHDPNNPDFGKDLEESEGENLSDEDEEEETVAQIISHDVDGVQQVEIKPIRSESEGYVVIEVPAEAGQVVMESGPQQSQRVVEVPRQVSEAGPSNSKILDPGQSFVARGFKARRGRPPKNDRGPVSKDSHLSTPGHLTAAQLVSAQAVEEDSNQEEMNEMRKGYTQDASENEEEEGEEVSQESGYHVIEAPDDEGEEAEEEEGEEEEEEEEPIPEIVVTPSKKRGRPKRAAAQAVEEASPAKVARTPRSTRGRKKAPQETAEEVEERQREEEKRKNIETSFGFDEILDDEEA